MSEKHLGNWLLKFILRKLLQNICTEQHYCYDVDDVNIYCTTVFCEMTW